jgi:hypothetical protein
MAKKVPTVVANKTVDFERELPGRSFVSFAVGPRGEPLLLSLDGEADDRVVAKSGASFPKLFADRRNGYRIHHRSDGAWTEISLSPTRENLSEIQPLPGDRWLAVRALSQNDADRNAHVYDANGRLLSSFAAGDGIQDVQTDEAGSVWVSYFDEGVFGGTTLSHSGLVCLSDAGELLFDFAAQSHACVGSMADCYALNVASSAEVWLRYYTDFPLVRIVDRGIADVWNKLPAEGSPAFAILNGRALFAGGYDERGKVVLVELGSRRSKKLSPIDEQGQPIEPHQFRGRGSVLYLVGEAALYRIDLATLD